MKSIALKEAVNLWQMSTPLEDQHVSESMLEELLQGKSKDSVFDHLALCNYCRQRVWALQASSAIPSEADDYVLPLAANVGIPHEATWVTADEKYRIEFRRMVADETQRAVLIVRVQPPFDFTGKTIVVRDANQRTLLRGRISEDGKVAAIVDEIDRLVLKKLTITED
jgi:hypothetical protein